MSRGKHVVGNVRRSRERLGSFGALSNFLWVVCSSRLVVIWPVSIVFKATLTTNAFQSDKDSKKF